MTAESYVITPPPQAAIPVAGTGKAFPVRRIWCVGRNYLEHIREMGQDEREPPFFFAKPADAIVPDGGTAPYPSLTKDMHHEVELVVALKSGGRNIPTDEGARLHLRLRRRHRPDPPRPADRLARHQAAVGGRQGVRRFGAVRAAQAGRRDRPSEQGPHRAQGATARCARTAISTQMIWNVPEIISKLSEMVELAAGDIIMTGTPSGVAATVAGDKLECEVEGVGKLDGDDRPAAEMTRPTRASRLWKFGSGVKVPR